MHRLSEHLYRFDDTCAVYVLRRGSEATLVDFGSGDVLDALPSVGVDRVGDVLVTHHHRDGVHGLERAARQGIRIRVPETERDLFDRVDAHWQARTLANSYDTREDRFSLVEPVPVHDVLRDHDTVRVGGFDVAVLPTPGHTTGSVTLLATVDGRRCAFTGDLIHSPGRVWSLAATQWSYNGLEGVAASVASLLDLRDRRPERLLPSHGAPMDDPEPAIDVLVERLLRLLRERGKNPRLLALRAEPFVPVCDGVLMNRTAMAYGYVLVSSSGAALLLDFGYDFVTGVPAGADRASRRPSLASIPALKRDHGVTRIEAVIPTHYHDDHVAGLNLLRRVEGAEVWAADLVADVLERPEDHDLPCLWYEPIAVDRRLPLGTPIAWHEYELVLHHLPGHAHHAVAVSFEAGGRRVLVVGDQYQGGREADPNYVYANGFGVADFARSAALYRELAPDLVLSGHWDPLVPDQAYLDTLDARGAAVAALHEALLPEGRRGDGPFGAAGVAAAIAPYRPRVRPGGEVALRVTVRNHAPHARPFTVRLDVPDAFSVEPGRCEGRLEPNAEAEARFRVTVGGATVRRARVVADLTLGDDRPGPVAEALVTVEEAP